MQVVVSKKDLSRLLGRCGAVADRKSTMPHLANVLITAEAPDRLRLAATDLYLAVSGVLPAQVERPGSIMVGARDLHERVRMMPEGPLAITVTEGAALTLRAVGSARRFTLHGGSADLFPDLPHPDAGAARLEVGVDAIARLITATIASISPDEGRLQLNSALFEWEPGLLRMVTTDGHRLSKLELTAPGVSGSGAMLVPYKGVQELRRLCDEARGEAEGEQRLVLQQSGHSAYFQIGGLTFSVKLVDAQFPPYQQVIPDSSERVVRAPRVALADAIKAVSVAASDRTGGVKLTLSAGTMRFESESPESGEGFDEVSVDYAGPTMTIGFNAKYFLEALSAMEDDEIALGLGGELDPAVVRPSEPVAGESFLAVVMPMRI